MMRLNRPGFAEGSVSLAMSGLSIVAGAGALLLPAWETAASEAASHSAVESQQKAGSATLEEKSAHCHVLRIAGVETSIVEWRWSLPPGRQRIDVECNYSERKTIRVNIWVAGARLTLEAEPQKLYLIEDYVEGQGSEFVWIEDATTGKVVSGNKPGRMQLPKLITVEEIESNRSTLGTGSALAVHYTAPRKPIHHLQILVNSKVIIDTYGNEDYSGSTAVAPGLYDVEVRVQNRVDYTYETHPVRIRFAQGKPRILEIKGSHWGKASLIVK